jgi:hypothetical protein
VWRRGCSLATLTDVVIAAVVLGPGTVDEVVDRVSGMADQPADWREAVRAWLTEVYPPEADGAFEGLAPDRLTERSIVDISRPCAVERLTARADQGGHARIAMSSGARCVCGFLRHGLAKSVVGGVVVEAAGVGQQLSDGDLLGPVPTRTQQLRVRIR